MFEVEKKIIEKIKDAISPQIHVQLAAEGPNIVFSCSTCSGSCEDTCKGRCAHNCHGCR